MSHSYNVVRDGFQGYYGETYSVEFPSLVAALTTQEEAEKTLGEIESHEAAKAFTEWHEFGMVDYQKPLYSIEKVY